MCSPSWMNITAPMTQLPCFGTHRSRRFTRWDSTVQADSFCRAAKTPDTMGPMLRMASMTWKNTFGWIGLLSSTESEPPIKGLLSPVDCRNASQIVANSNIVNEFALTFFSWQSIRCHA